MPLRKPGVDDVLAALLEQERALRAVDHDTHFAFGLRGLRQRPRHVRVLRNAGGEALDPHALGEQAARDQRAADRIHHAFGSADERVVDVVDGHPLREQRVGLRAIDAAVQELDVLRLARQHVDEIEPAEIAVFERGELVAEHHRRRRAVAVDQREPRARLRDERRRDDRQQRRDAAAGGDAQIVARGCPDRR